MVESETQVCEKMKTKHKYPDGGTKRFCDTCKNKTAFDFNPNSGHSYCRYCGDYQISKLNLKELYPDQKKGIRTLYDSRKGTLVQRKRKAKSVRAL